MINGYISKSWNLFILIFHAIKKVCIEFIIVNYPFPKIRDTLVSTIQTIPEHWSEATGTRHAIPEL
jgi:hypothetical protein